MIGGRVTRGQSAQQQETEAFQRPTRRHTVRRALRWFLLWDLAVLAVVVSAVVLLSWMIARNEAVRDAEAIARAVAETMVAALAHDDFHANDPAALAEVSAVMSQRSADGPIGHITVWVDAGYGRGTVLWSDQEPLVGQTFMLEEEAYAVFGTQDTISAPSDPEPGEGGAGLSSGQFIDVHTGTRDAAGDPLLFEVFIPTGNLPDKMLYLVGLILPLPIAALVALSLATLPLAVSLAHRVDRGQRRVQRLLVNAAESSDLERRRIAQDLHDGVVQDLAGIGYALDSDAAKLPPDGALRHRLEEMGDILRRDLVSLRTLMTDIYPPDLRARGLAEIVRDLGVRPDVAPGIVRFEIEEPLRPHALTDRLAYRAIREALTNALNHAQALSVLIRIEQDDASMTFEVMDDGVGFDPTTTAPVGHLGMRLISEMVADAGGTMTVESAAGRGSRVRGVLPL